MNKKIPNFNSFSTILDRLIIEKIKKTHFEHKMAELKELSGQEYDELERKILLQDEMVEGLKQELHDLFLDVLATKQYLSFTEERTFTK